MIYRLFLKLINKYNKEHEYDLANEIANKLPLYLENIMQ